MTLTATQIKRMRTPVKVFCAIAAAILVLMVWRFITKHQANVEKARWDCVQARDIVRAMERDLKDQSELLRDPKIDPASWKMRIAELKAKGDEVCAKYE